MTESVKPGSGPATLDPHVQKLAESVAAVRLRFIHGDPPIRSIHLSGPSKPQPKPQCTRVWFLVADDEKLAWANARGLLNEIEDALALELALRGNPERELGGLVVAIATVGEHDSTRCRRKPGAVPLRLSAESITGERP